MSEGACVFCDEGRWGFVDRRDYYPADLSVGQKQRAVIARALISHPKIVLADEQTTALDKKSGRDVVNILHDLAQCQGCTVLLITTIIALLDIADRIIYLEDGRLSKQPILV